MKIELLNHCASDLDVVNAARVSFAQQSDWIHSEWGLVTLPERDAGLINFLMRERHGTPFEHGFFKFHVEAPIFVFREWHRHRVGHSYNEMSGRYVELEDKFYRPDEWRYQDGKPGHYTYGVIQSLGDIAEANQLLESAYTEAWHSYQELLAIGVAKEQARTVLPVGIYSQMIWSCNPRSLMHFCGLRCAPNAQKEIRDLATQAFGALKTAMPVTAGAFEVNGFQAP